MKQEERAGHLLPEQEIYWLRISLLLLEKARLCFGIGNTKAMSLHALPYHELISRMEKPALFGRLARWQLFLDESYITYITQKFIKG